MAHLSTACAVERGPTFSAELDNGEPDLEFNDDGVWPDAIAGDGVYTAPWTPELVDPVTLSVSALQDGTLYSSSVLGEVVRYVTVEEGSVDSGDKITVISEGLPEPPRKLNNVRVYLYRAGEIDHTAHIARGERIEYTPDGTLSYRVPEWAPSGEYELRVGGYINIASNDGFATLGISNPFSVTGRDVTVDDSEVGAGEYLSVNWERVKLDGVRVGLYRPGAGPRWRHAVPHPLLIGLGPARDTYIRLSLQSATRSQ